MNKNIIIGLAILILILVGGFVWYFMSNSVSSTSDTTNTQTNNPVAVTPDSVQDVSDQTTGTVASAISYANALVKYADRRIQLDPTCQAHPNTVTYKDNTGIMIDNRSSQTRTVKVGITFVMKPYTFKIVVLPDVYLVSKTLLIDCDQSQNVATVLVQE